MDEIYRMAAAAPTVLEYGLLGLATLTILGLLVILHRSVQKHAAAYPPELGESLLRLWVAMGAGTRRTATPLDDELYQIVDPLVRAVLRQLQEAELEEVDDEVEKVGQKMGHISPTNENK